MVTLKLSEQSPGRVYELMASLVIPRPIAFVSSISANKTPNLAPFSYFNIGGLNPPSLTICTVLGPNGEPKDTFTNIQSTGEFVVNLVTRAMADGMNQTAPNFPHEVNEWPLSGFTPLASEYIKPARVAESPVQMECSLYETLAHGSGPGASRYIIGEILAIHLQESILAESELTPVDLIARLGKSEYLDLASHSRFELPRPKLPEDK